MRLPLLLALLLALLAPTSPDLAAAPASITTAHGDGFTPSRLQLDRAARLVGRTLRLHPGTADTIGAANHMKPVNVSGAWTVEFDFVAAGGSFAFSLHNAYGYSNGFYGSTTADLATMKVGKIHCVFRVDSGASTYGLRVGAYTGLGHAAPASTPDGGNPGSGPDLANGHDWRARLEWTPATGDLAGDGSAHLVLTDLGTAQVWGLTYTGLPAIPPMFRLAEGYPDGTRVHVGFSSQTGGSSRPAVVLKRWAWTDADGTPPAAAGTGRLTVASPGVYSAGAYVDGKLKALLAHNIPLNAGQYLVRSDGFDELGAALPSSHEIKAIRSASTGTSQLIGHKPGVQAAVPWDLYGALSNQGMSVTPDGSTVLAMTWDQDSVGQTGRFPMEAATGDCITNLAQFIREYSGLGQGAAWLDSQKYLYLTTYDDHAPATYFVEPSRIAGGVSFGFDGPAVPEPLPPEGSRLVHTNPDGSYLEWGQTARVTLRLVFSAGNDARYHLVPRIAADATAGRFAVTVKYAHYVGEYDASTGHQVGGKIEVPNPCAVCYLPDGTIAVAHSVVSLDEDGEQVYHTLDDPDPDSCPATIISLFSPSSHTLLGTMPISGFVDITDLSCRNGRLAIFDNGPGRKCVKVHAVAGHTLGSLQRTHFRQATPDDDDGRHTLWQIGGGCIDDAGNVYVNSNLYGTNSRNSGTLAVSLAEDGTYRWSNYGLGFTNGAVAGPDNQPDIVLTSMLNAMKRRDDGEYEFIGSTAYAGGQDGSNPILGIENGQVPAPMTLAHLGGVDFVAIPANHRLPIFRHLGDNRIKPAASFGFRDVAGVLDLYTWTNPGNADTPTMADATIVAANPSGSSPTINKAQRMQLAPNGDVWFSDEVGDKIWRVPLAGLNSAGNPTYNPASRVLVASPSPSTYQPTHNAYLAVASDAFYVLSGDERFGQYTSNTFNAFTEGGCKGLFAFNLDGSLLWRIALPEYCHSIAAAPGRVAVAGMGTSRIHVYRKSDGLPDLTIEPVTEADQEDFTGGALAAHRLATGVVRITSESIRASGYLLSDYIDAAPSPTYSATLAAGQTSDLVEVAGDSAGRVKVWLRRAGGRVIPYLRRAG